MNNRGQSLSGWFEVFVFSLLFMGAIVLVITSYNQAYGTDIETNFGSDAFENTEGSIEDIGEQVNSFQDKVNDGKFTFSDGIIIFGTIGSILKSIVLASLSFITGGWVNDVAVNLLGLSGTTAVVLRILFSLSIIFILIKLIFKFKS